MPDFYQATYSIFTQAPPIKVYEALTDWGLRSQWREGMAMEWEGDSKAFLNQKVSCKVKGLFPYSFSFRVAGLEPPRRLFMEYTGSLQGRSALEITPQAGGSLTAFHWMKVKPVGFWPRLYFLLGLGTRSHRNQTTKTLRLLQEHLESKLSPAPRHQDSK